MAKNYEKIIHTMKDKKILIPKVYNKKPRSYTLTDETVELLGILAKMDNRSKSNMFEYLVEEKAREKGLTSDNIEKNGR